jgi:hypothetical protein
MRTVLAIVLVAATISCGGQDAGPDYSSNFAWAWSGDTSFQIRGLASPPTTWFGSSGSEIAVIDYNTVSRLRRCATPRA